MLAAALSAGTVLAAETIVRTRINRAPDGTYPHTLIRRVRIRRAHNRGLIGSRLEKRPALVMTVQCASTLVALGTAAIVLAPSAAAPLYARIGVGLLVGGALANTGERLIRGSVTDYVHLYDSPIPLLRRRIWNLADAAIFNGAILTVTELVGGIF